MMRCPICHQHPDITPAGTFAMHRVEGKDRFTFCDGSGEPAYIGAVARDEARTA